MARKHGIIAYATMEDRMKLSSIVERHKAKSASDWIIKMIRREYERLKDE